MLNVFSIISYFQYSFLLAYENEQIIKILANPIKYYFDIVRNLNERCKSEHDFMDSKNGEFSIGKYYIS